MPSPEQILIHVEAIDRQAVRSALIVAETVDRLGALERSIPALQAVVDGLGREIADLQHVRRPRASNLEVGKL